MKKTGSICLLLALLLGLLACGKSTKEKWQEQYELGMKYVSEGNYEEAVIAFTAAIEIDPKSADAYLALADVYEAQGDTESLQAVLEQGLEATGDERFQERLDMLLEAAEESEFTTVTLDGRSYVEIRVQGELFHTLEAYREKYDEYLEQYQDHWFAYANYGIRFVEPVTVTLNGETVTISEVNCNGFYGSREKMDLVDEMGEIPAGVYVFEGLIGENEFPNNVSEDIGYVGEYDGVEFDEYQFKPWGDYEFLIDTIEAAE